MVMNNRSEVIMVCAKGLVQFVLGGYEKNHSGQMQSLHAQEYETFSTLWFLVVLSLTLISPIPDNL
jgi:phosphatidylglycerophosphatase A